MESKRNTFAHFLPAILRRGCLHEKTRACAGKFRPGVTAWFRIAFTCWLPDSSRSVCTRSSQPRGLLRTERLSGCASFHESIHEVYSWFVEYWLILICIEKEKEKELVKRKNKEKTKIKQGAMHYGQEQGYISLKKNSLVQFKRVMEQVRVHFMTFHYHAANNTNCEVNQLEQGASIAITKWGERSWLKNDLHMFTGMKNVWCLLT